MVRYRRLRIQRSNHRYLQLLRQFHHLALGAGAHDAAAGDDDRLLRLGQRGQRIAHPLHVGLRPERRHAGEFRLDQRYETGFLLGQMGAAALNLQVHRTGSARRRFAKHLAQHIGKPGDGIDTGVEFGDRIELREILHLLISMTVTPVGRWAAGDGDDR